MGRSSVTVKNREVTLHGINVAGDAKQPFKPDMPSHEPNGFLDGDNVSFVGRPFPLDDAPKHFARLRRWGYNIIRYIFTWEAIEAKGPGQYDEEWIQHTIQTLRIAKSFGFYVFMDPHQDVWSRFTGGSGAPMWTLYACGLDPEAFSVTEAALVQNEWPEPKKFPKMIWATNYYRLACQAVFTMFWAGRHFTPKAIMDGKNIQDYLQGHYIAACQHLALRIQEAGDLTQECVLGFESMNEPNRGLIGFQDLTAIPSEQKLQKGTSPTAWQAMLTGSGRSCEVAVWDVGTMGPYKTGSRLIDPRGQVAWLPANYDDSKYGWKRDPGWKLGQCIWAQHGIWDPRSDALLKRDYFAKNPETGEEIDYPYFTQHYFMAYWRKYSAAIREVFPGAVMFCQPPTLELPPVIKNTADDDPNMVYTPHWYDGLTLMTKKWNRVWNVDVLGVMRGRYMTPAFAIKLGETAIRNCFKEQLGAIRKEGLDNMGLHPCLFSELGIPYDMDDGYAYRTGDYSSQISAMDANHFALEGNKLAFTLWTYVATNVHEWGDQWNGEDLSIYSKDDPLLPSTSSEAIGSKSYDRESPSYSKSRLEVSGESSSSTTRESMSMTVTQGDGEGKGFRAAEAYVRPTPIATHGDVLSFGFQLHNCEFKLSLDAASNTAEDAPTEVFLPEFHFPKDATEVVVSGGKWTITDQLFGGVSMQVLRWWHAAGEQSLEVRGVKRNLSASEEGYIDQCREKGCVVM